MYYNAGKAWVTQNFTWLYICACHRTLMSFPAARRAADRARNVAFGGHHHWLALLPSQVLAFMLLTATPCLLVQ